MKTGVPKEIKNYEYRVGLTIMLPQFSAGNASSLSRVSGLHFIARNPD